MDHSFTISAILTFVILAYLIISYLTPDPEDKIIEGYTIQGTGSGVSSTEAKKKIDKSVLKLKDKFLISKYRENYNNIILQADELLNLQMLNQVIALTNDGATDLIVGSIGKLKQAKDALNDVMKYVEAAKA
jgi:hypothetical protein